MGFFKNTAKTQCEAPWHNDNATGEKRAYNMYTCNTWQGDMCTLDHGEESTHKKYWRKDSSHQLLSMRTFNWLFRVFVPFHTSGSSAVSLSVDAAVMRTRFRPACGDRLPRRAAIAGILQITKRKHFNQNKPQCVMQRKQNWKKRSNNWNGSHLCHFLSL